MKTKNNDEIEPAIVFKATTIVLEVLQKEIT